MFQDSLPLARRGRKTVVLALFVFLAASVVAVVNRMEDDVPVPSTDASTAESSDGLTSARLASTTATEHSSSLPRQNRAGFDSDSSSEAGESITRVNLESPELRATAIRIRRSESDSSRRTVPPGHASISDSISTQQWRQSTTSAILPTREPRPLGGTYIALVLLIVGSGVALWLKRTKRPSHSDTTIMSLAKMALPNHQEVRLIRVRDREILIALTQSSVTVLQTFDVAQVEQTPSGSQTTILADLHTTGDIDPTFTGSPGQETSGKIESQDLDRTATAKRSAAITVDHPAGSDSNESRLQRRSFGAHLLERTQSTTEADND